MLKQLLTDIENDLSKEIELSFNYQDIAKKLYPFLLQEYQRDYKTISRNHIENLKKTITKKQ